LDELDNAKKELIYERLYDDKNRIAIFVRYMFWRWEVELESLSDPGEDPCDDVSDFILNKLSHIFDLFSKSIYYLGPLREDPKALYPYPNNDDSFDLGRKGEHTADVLFLHGGEEHEFPLPNQEGEKVKTAKTIDAIKQWLTHIGVAEDIKTELTESGITLKITAVRFNHKTPPEKAEVGAKRFLAEAVLRYTIPR
jgi:hypothetical protein